MNFRKKKLSILIIRTGNFYILLQNLSPSCYQLLTPGILQEERDLVGGLRTKRDEVQEYIYILEGREGGRVSE